MPLSQLGLSSWSGGDVSPNTLMESIVNAISPCQAASSNKVPWPDSSKGGRQPKLFGEAAPVGTTTEPVLLSRLGLSSFTSTGRRKRAPYLWWIEHADVPRQTKPN